MANVGDIIQITHTYRASGELSVNVFYFEIDVQTIVDVPLIDWLDQLADKWETGLAEIWHTSTISLTIRADNLTDGVEFAELATGFSGSETGEKAPSFIAIPVRLNRASKITRNGAKRISGITEDAFNGNLLTLTGNQPAGVITYCALVHAFVDIDGQGTNIELDQRIIGRTLNAQNVYELDLSKVNAITGVVIGANVSTQNSRKA